MLIVNPRSKTHISLEDLEQAGLLDKQHLLEIQGLSLSSMMKVADVKPEGTDAQTLSASVWNTRHLNTVEHNSITGAHLMYRLPYDNASGSFQLDGTITSASGATAKIYWDTGTYLEIYDIQNGPFLNNEQITGHLQGTTADVDNLSPEDAPTGCDYEHAVYLPVGLYFIDFDTPVHATDHASHTLTKARWWNGSNFQRAIRGTNAKGEFASYAATMFLTGRDQVLVDLSGKKFSLQVYTDEPTSGGSAANGGEDELYSQASIFKAV